MQIHKFSRRKRRRKKSRDKILKATIFTIRDSKILDWLWIFLLLLLFINSTRGQTDEDVSDLYMDPPIVIQGGPLVARCAATIKLGAKNFGPRFTVEREEDDNNCQMENFQLLNVDSLKDRCKPEHLLDHERGTAFCECSSYKRLSTSKVRMSWYWYLPDHTATNVETGKKEFNTKIWNKDQEIKCKFQGGQEPDTQVYIHVDSLYSDPDLYSVCQNGSESFKFNWKSAAKTPIDRPFEYKPTFISWIFEPFPDNHKVNIPIGFGKKPKDKYGFCPVARRSSKCNKKSYEVAIYNYKYCNGANDVFATTDDQKFNLLDPSTTGCNAPVSDSLKRLPVLNIADITICNEGFYKMKLHIHINNKIRFEKHNPCPSDFFANNSESTCLKRTDSEEAYSSAKTSCQDGLPGQLATPLTKEELDDVMQHRPYPTQRKTLIGFKKSSAGSSVTFTKPDSSGTSTTISKLKTDLAATFDTTGGGDCFAIPAGEKRIIETVDCSEQNYYLCEHKVCPDGYKYFGNGNNSRCYKKFTGKKTYNQSKAECVSQKGILAMPKDPDEHYFISQLGNKKEKFWIGLDDQDVEGTFKFVDGTAVVWERWITYEGKYQDILGQTLAFAEDCAVINPDFDHYWQSEKCTEQYEFVCSVPMKDKYKAKRKKRQGSGAKPAPPVKLPPVGPFPTYKFPERTRNNLNITPLLELNAKSELAVIVPPKITDSVKLYIDKEFSQSGELIIFCAILGVAAGAEGSPRPNLTLTKFNTSITYSSCGRLVIRRTIVDFTANDSYSCKLGGPAISGTDNGCDHCCANSSTIPEPVFVTGFVPPIVTPRDVRIDVYMYFIFQILLMMIAMSWCKLGLTQLYLELDYRRVISNIRLETEKKRARYHAYGVHEELVFEEEDFATVIVETIAPTKYNFHKKILAREKKLRKKELKQQAEVDRQVEDLSRQIRERARRAAENKN